MNLSMLILLAALALLAVSAPGRAGYWQQNNIVITSQSSTNTANGIATCGASSTVSGDPKNYVQSAAYVSEPFYTGCAPYILSGGATQYAAIEQKGIWVNDGDDPLSDTGDYQIWKEQTQADITLRSAVTIPSGGLTATGSASSNTANATASSIGTTTVSQGATANSTVTSPWYSDPVNYNSASSPVTSNSSESVSASGSVSDYSPSSTTSWANAIAYVQIDLPQDDEY